MKKNYLIVASCITILTFYDCSSTKTIAKVDNAVEVKIPFSGKEYQSDKNYFRATQVGESPDLATAKKIAVQNAKAGLAANVQALVKRVTDQYTKQTTIGNKRAFENTFEELSREVVSQELSDIKIIGEKLFKLKNGNYRYHIAVEGSKETILNAITDRATKNPKLNFDKSKYEKIFDSEMEKQDQPPSTN